MRECEVGSSASLKKYSLGLAHWPSSSRRNRDLTGAVSSALDRVMPAPKPAVNRLPLLAVGGSVGGAELRNARREGEGEREREREREPAACEWGQGGVQGRASCDSCEACKHRNPPKATHPPSVAPMADDMGMYSGCRADARAT